MHFRTLDFLSVDACLRICCIIECNMWDTPLIPRGESDVSHHQRNELPCPDIVAQWAKGICRIIPYSSPLRTPYGRDLQHLRCRARR